MRKSVGELVFILGVVFLSAVFLAFGGGIADARFGHNSEPPWPGLSVGQYAFAGTRFRPPYILPGAAASGNRYRTSNISSGSPAWTPTGYKFLYQCWYGTGSTAPERLPTTPCRIGGAAASTVANGLTGQFVRLTFGCATCYSITLAPGDFVWADAPLFAPGANTMFWVRTYLAMNVGDNVPVGMYCNLQGSDLQEGSVNSSSAQTLVVSGGTINAMNSNSQCYGPSTAVALGWDGTSPSFLIDGTSRLWGTNLYRLASATRGNLTAVERGLDSTVGGRMSYGNFSAPGACAQYTSANYGQQFQLRMRALRALPNRPYNREASDFDPNGINNGCGSSTLAGAQALYLDHFNFVQTNCLLCKLYLFYGEPWANTANNLTFWSNLADQVPSATATYPGGLQFQVNGSLNPGSWLPSYATPINMSAAYQDTVFPDKWRVPAPAITGTYSGSCNSGLRSCAMVLSALPAIGDNLVSEPGLANSETNIISNVTGTAGAATIFFGPTTAKTHANGAAVTTAYTRDGVHEDDTLAVSGETLVTTAKTGGVIN